jgi:hypothetical protein
MDGLAKLMGDRPTQLEWKGAWRSATADDVRFQPVIGKSVEGMRAGVRIHHRGTEPKIIWSPMTHDLEGAAKESERFADAMLKDRERDLEHSSTYLGKLDQLMHDKEVLAKGDPSNRHQEEQMLGALHREREREWGR